MRPRRFYKHKKMTDVAIFPIDVFYNSDEQSYIIKFKWTNIASDRIDIQGPLLFNMARQEIIIKKDEIDDWEEYSPNNPPAFM